LKEKATASKLVLAYFGDDTSSKEYKTFVEVANNAAVGEKFAFVHLHDKDCAGEHKASHPSVVLFRQFDTSPVVYSGNWDTEAIVEWAKPLMVPTLIEFSEDFIEPIFGAKQPAIFLFRTKEDAKSDFA